MSWNPLRKLPPILRPELDATTQNANETLEKLESEFDSAENIIKTLYQSVKKLLDNVLCTGKFEVKLTEDITSSNLFLDDNFMQTVLEEWHSFAFQSNTIGDDYVISLQKTIIEPLKHLKQAFAELRAAIRLHDSIQLDVIKFQRKVALYEQKEKTGVNLVKLQENKLALTASEKEYGKRTQMLINDLSKFLTGSVQMLQPILEGFIAAELAWITACKKSLDSKPNLNLAVGSESLQDRGRNIEDLFKSIGSLSICSEQTSK